MSGGYDHEFYIHQHITSHRPLALQETAEGEVGEFGTLDTLVFGLLLHGYADGFFAFCGFEGFAELTQIGWEDFSGEVFGGFEAVWVAKLLIFAIGRTKHREFSLHLFLLNNSLGTWPFLGILL